MRKKINLFYPIWVWLATLALMPVVSFVSVFFEDKPNFHSFFKVFSIIILYSLGFSLPVMIIYCLSFFRLIKTRMLVIHIKLLLILIVLTGLTITMLATDLLNIYLFVIYSIPLVAASLVFRIQSRKYLPVKQFDLFEVKHDINPVVPKGSRGTILEVWEDGVFEVEFLDAGGQNIIYEGNRSFTIKLADIGHYEDPDSKLT